MSSEQSLSAGRAAASRILRATAEVMVLALVVLSPWAFGAVEPVFEGLVLGGVGVLLILWACHFFLLARVSGRHSPVALGLGGLIIFTGMQLVPIPPAVLTILSHHTIRLETELLPAEAEVFSGETLPLAPLPGATCRVSLYPHATRGVLLKFLTVFLVFALVRDLLNRAATRRLAWVCLVNGTLLALFALAQSFSSPGNLVYWTFPTEGTVFGPFICRNHFPFYMDLCIGLGVGLLSSSSTEDTNRHRPPISPGLAGLAERALAILQSPRDLWLVCALGLMGVASAYSLSRGGMVSQLFAGGVCALIWLRSNYRTPWWSALAWALAVMLFLALWFGLKPLDDRLATLGDKNAIYEARLVVWRSLLPEVPHFPLLGTGGGTSEFVEPMHRAWSSAGAMSTIEYAHNEYLEALVEGGLVRLGLTLYLVLATLRRGWTYLRRSWGSGHGQVLGLFWALTAIAVHSFLDFGVHIPAVALLTAVVAAHYFTLLEAEPRRRDSAVGPPRRLLAYAIGGLLVPLAALLIFSGWKADRLERLRLAARAASQEPEIGRVTEPVEYLEAAVRLAPDDAVVHQSLGQVHLNDYYEGLHRQELVRQHIGVIQAVAAGFEFPSTGTALRTADAASGRTLAAVALRPEIALRLDHMRPALEHLVIARNLCPLLAHPHARLAERRVDFVSPDAAVTYWKRAIKLLPFEPELWFACGWQHLEDGRPDAAWPLWRRNLEVANVKLPKILERALPLLGPTGLIDQVLPDRADVLIAASEHIYPSPQDAELRRPFVEKAIMLWDGTAAPNGTLLRRKAALLKSLNRADQAIASYREALKLEPRQSDWRLELALLLRERGRLEEARAELLILDSRGGGKVVRDWLDVVNREIELK